MSSFDGASSCILNLDNKHLFDHRIFLDKQMAMLNQRKNFGYKPFADSLIDQYVLEIVIAIVFKSVSVLFHQYQTMFCRSFIFSFLFLFLFSVRNIISHFCRYCMNFQLIHAGMDLTDEQITSFQSRLSALALRHWPFQRAYRDYEVLQQLPFDEVNHCSEPGCNGINMDGTLLSIRASQLHIAEPEKEKHERTLLATFQQHTLIKGSECRNLLWRYVWLLVDFF